MKKITLLLGILISTMAFSQTIVNFDVNTFKPDPDGSGIGFMAVFDNPKDGNLGGFQFQQGWGIPDLVSEIGPTTLTLKPNRIGDTNSYWQTGGVLEGNKIMEASHFVEDPSLRGENFIFTGNVVSNTLDGSSLSYDFQAVVFIKVFNADFSSQFEDLSVPIPASGDFSISLDASAYNTDEVIQYGFRVIGPNINSNASFDADYDNFGSIVMQAAQTQSTDDLLENLFSVSPNPTKDRWNIKGLSTTINTIEVFDILGKRVQKLTPNQTDTAIDGSQLKTGIYMAKLYSDNGTKTIKLVKN